MKLETRRKIWFETPTRLLDKYQPLDILFKKNIAKVVSPRTDVDVKWHPGGFSRPSFSYTITYNAIYGIQAAYKAERKGYDAVVVGCFFDPGLRESRSIVKIPVVGAAEAALHVAYLLGNKCSIISVSPVTTPLIEDMVKSYGMKERVARVTHVGLSPEDEGREYVNPEKLADLFTKRAKKTVEEDGAEVIIPGCTVMSTFLTDRGVTRIEDAPVIDPVLAGIKMAELLVDLRRTLGVEVCKRTIYRACPDWEKEIPISSED